jgi:hypothetical protein
MADVIALIEIYYFLSDTNCLDFSFVRGYVFFPSFARAYYIISLRAAEEALK